MSPKKPKHVASHVFTEITHIVAAPHGMACLFAPATRLSYTIRVLSKSVDGVSEPREGGGACRKFGHSTLTCTTTLQDVIWNYLMTEQYYSASELSSSASFQLVLFCRATPCKV